MSGHRFGMAAALAVVMSLTIFSAKAEKMAITDEAQIKDSEIKKKVPQKNMKSRARELQGKRALSVPGTGKLLDRDAMRNQDAARAARDLQQLQKMHEAQRAMQPGNRATGMRNQVGMDGRDGNSLRERAAGSGDRPGAGSATFGGGKSGARPPPGPVNHNTGPRDYRAGTQNSATERRRGGFSQQPASPASGANIRGSGQASWGGKADEATKSGSKTSTFVDSSGNKHTVTETAGKDKSTQRTVEIRRPDGASRHYETTSQADGSSTTSMVERDSKGNAVTKETTVLDRDGNVIKHVGSGAAGQPGVHDGSVSGNKNCNWNPVWGRCMGEKGPSQKDMTAQPSSGDEDTASTGGSARPRLGAEAVTNPGDGSWTAGRSGNTGGGPIDMRDPPKGIPGTGPVPR